MCNTWLCDELRSILSQYKPQRSDGTLLAQLHHASKKQKQHKYNVIGLLL